MRVTLILRMHSDRRVAEDRFRTRGRDRDPLTLLTLIPLPLLPRRRGDAHYTISYVIQLGVHLLVDHLLIAHGSKRLRIPVHHPQSAVHKAFLVQIDEHIKHRFAQIGLHRETRAIPIAARAQLLQLLKDHAAVLLLPRKGVLKEFFAADRTFPYALFRQQTHHFRFRGNAGVIGPGHPARVLAQHARAAHEHILDRVVQHVPHVQHAGNIRRRDHDSVWFAIIGHTAEVALLHPVLVPLALALRGIETFGKFHCGCKGTGSTKLRRLRS